MGSGARLEDAAVSPLGARARRQLAEGPPWPRGSFVTARGRVANTNGAVTWKAERRTIHQSSLREEKRAAALCKEAAREKRERRNVNRRSDSLRMPKKKV